MKPEVIIAAIAASAEIINEAIAVWGQIRVTDLQRDLAREATEHEGEIAALNTEVEQRFTQRTPFLERQLALDFEASYTASKLATLSEGPEREFTRQRF